MKQNRNREISKNWYKNRYQKMRIHTLDFLGGRCAVCSFSDYDVLQIDHIIPIKLSAGKRMSNNQMFFHILNGNISKNELQILCANCHMKKTVLELRKKSSPTELFEIFE